MSCYEAPRLRKSALDEVSNGLSLLLFIVTSLMISTNPVALETTNWVLMTPTCLSLAWLSPLNFSFLYSTVCSKSQPGCYDRHLKFNMFKVKRLVSPLKPASLMVFPSQSMETLSFWLFQTKSLKASLSMRFHQIMLL